jgi:hypothetical protein
LRRDTALRCRGTGIVAPQQLSVVSPNGIQVNPFRRKDARAEIGDAFIDQDAGPYRPQRDHLAAAQHLTLAGRTAKLPQQAAVLAVQTVDMAVVGSDIDSILPRGRRQPHRPAGQKSPTLPARVCIETNHAAIRRRTEKDAVAGGDHVKRVIEVDPALLGQPVPAAHRPRIRLAPGRRRLVPRLVDPTRSQGAAGSDPRSPRCGRCHRDTSASHWPRPTAGQPAPP